MPQTDRKKPTSFRRLVFELSVRNTLIPVLVVVSVFLLFYNLYTQHVLVRRNAELCENSCRRMQAICRSYTGYLEGLALSDMTEAVLNNGETEALYEDFYRFLNTQNYRGTFYLLDRSKALIASLNSGESNTNVNSVRRLANRAEQNGNAIMSEKTIIAISYTSNERSRAYTVVVPVVRDHEAKGFLAYRFYEQGLEAFLNAEGAQIFVLTDRNGGIIASNAEMAADALDRFVPEVTSGNHCTVRGEKYYIASKAVSGTELTLYTLSRQISFISGEGIALILLILAAALLSYLTYSRSLARRITEPVDEVLEAIQQLKTGDFTPTESITKLAEFRQIFDEYNSAIRQLDKLMETQQSLKIRQLEAQFNPHFLYNVLETLKYTIATDTEAAQDIVLRLSHLMRYAAKPAEGEVTLGEDMVYLEDYLALQKQRFLDRLQYSLGVTEEAKDAKIFRLLLQPLIENSIKYGYVARQNISVDVRCRVEGDDLVMTVEDNGGGMTDERLEEIQNALSSGVNATNCLGLFNTHQMIKLKYGDPFGLTLANREGEGLTVRVVMPFMR